jgi:hypothetical protein
MMDPDAKWQIGETMAEVFRERLVELETLEAIGDAPEEIVSGLAFVRKMLIQFDARDTSTAKHQRKHAATREAGGFVTRALPSVERALIF